MITEPEIQSAMAVIYGITAIISFTIARRAEKSVRVYAYVVVGVVLVSAVGAALSSLGVGDIPAQFADEGVTSAPSFVDDSIAYAVLFGLTTFLAGASEKMIGLVAGLSFSSRLAVEMGTQFGSAVVLIGISVSILTYLVRVYLLWGPVWRASESVPDRRQLLFRKSRNLLMLLMGANIFALPLIAFGLLDTFGQLLVLNYIDLLMRIGFAGFLLSNIGVLGIGGAAQEATSKSRDLDHVTTLEK